MQKKRKRFAVFGCNMTGLYRRDLCRELNEAAISRNVDLLYINSYGTIEGKNARYGEYEFDMIDELDLSGFDGIIFDGEGYNVEGMEEKVIRKLRSTGCPVVSISSIVEGFYNVEFDDAGGMRALVKHINLVM